MTTPTAGVFDQPPGDAYQQPSAGGKKRTTFLVVFAVLAAAVIGGGAFAVTRMLGGGGEQPASALPAETAAYLRVDIDPSVGQKISAVRFFDGLDDQFVNELRDGDIRETAFNWVSEESEAFAGLDYAEDIEPWLGDRLGMGIVPDGSEEPLVAIALQVKDETSADEILNELEGTSEAGSVDWFFHGDYVVLTEQGDVDTLQQMVEAGTLADRDTFRADVEALGDEGVMSGWVDTEPMMALADSAVDGLSTMDPSGLAASLGGTPQLAGDTATGRYAAAMRFSPDHVEVHGVARGLDVPSTEGDSAQLILDLPEDTVAAFGLENGDQFFGDLYETFRTQAPDEVAQMEAEATQAGFTLPDDVQVLLGSSLSLSVGPGLISAFEQNTDPDRNPELFEIAYRTETDTDRMEEMMSYLAEISGAGPEFDQFVQRSIDDGVMTIGMSQPYVEGVAGGGSLGDSDAFQAAVPNAADADTVFFVNMNSVEHLYLDSIPEPQMRSSMAQLASIGWSASQDGENGEFTLRFVADE